MPAIRKRCSSERVCLLTGASGTLGTAFAKAYGAEYEIAAAFHRQMPELPTQDQYYVDPLFPSRALRENRKPLFAIRADLGSTAEIERLVEAVIDRYGRIDVLINAAVRYDFGPLTG